jgi:hypothetical protein
MSLPQQSEKTVSRLHITYRHAATTLSAALASYSVRAGMQQRVLDGIIINHVMRIHGQQQHAVPTLCHCLSRLCRMKVFPTLGLWAADVGRTGLLLGSLGTLPGGVMTISCLWMSKTCIHSAGGKQ